MPVTAVVGGHWGDEGKGKVINLLARDADLVIRGHGGANAGHTVVNEQGRFAVHLIPAGIFNPRALCVIGPGVAVHPGLLVAELDELGQREIDTSGLRVSTAAHLVMPYHQSLDKAEDDAREGQRLGTTGRGIGPTYVDKSRRIGLRVGDLLDPARFREKLQFVLDRKYHELAAVGVARPNVEAMADEYLAYAERLKPFIAETQPLIDEAVARGRQVLLEGAHATLLDLDHGTYPYVTSSHCTVAGLLQGSGVGPRRLTRAIGVYKAYCSRVGEGPFPSELFDETSERIREIGHEYGTTTGRPRRVGWFDAVAGRHTSRVNAFDGVALTRLDLLAGLPELKICVAYAVDGEQLDYFPSQVETLQRCKPIYETFEGWAEPLKGARGWADLPPHAQAYVRRLEVLLEAPVQLIGVGEAREEIIQL
ncbi:MAG TPA: adenylosuccinate synthase [Chloroflexota bacterium]|jgi:adenylosuccinate synthase|nr:adenylosuccinate synthase [Chloroflexota bacterium]